MFGKKESYSYTNLKNLDRLDTFIGRSTNLKGDITTQGSIRIDGQLEGNVYASEAIITGPESFIKGNLDCKDAIISGRVEGNVSALENVELQSGANILGDITCGNLVIGKNCFFEGKCHMSGKEAGKI
jgi:cytoskeletal protein CcmA (bactofilin family)